MIPRVSPAVVCGAMCLAGIASSLSADELPRLIRQLGADEYQTRQSAQQRILDFGPEALPSLKTAARHPDREVQLRAALLTDRLRTLRNSHLMDELLAEPSRPAPPGLPYWREFSLLVGDSRDARNLYREMLRAEPELLTALDEGSPLLHVVLSDRVAKLEGEVYFGRQMSLELVDPASVSVLLLSTFVVESESQPPLAIFLENVLVRTVMDPPADEQSAKESSQAAAAAEDAGKRRVLRELLDAWVASPDTAAMRLRLQKAQEFSLPSGVVPAREALRSSVASLRERADAVMLIASCGGVEHIPDLEPLLTDTTELSLHRRRRGTSSGREVNAEGRMQDLALAALVKLTRQEPRAYQFAGLTDAEPPAYSQSGFGFATDAGRMQALQRWRDWSREHLRWPHWGGWDAVAGTTL